MYCIFTTLHFFFMPWVKNQNFDDRAVWTDTIFVDSLVFGIFIQGHPWQTWAFQIPIISNYTILESIHVYLLSQYWVKEHIWWSIISFLLNIYKILQLIFFFQNSALNSGRVPDLIISIRLLLNAHRRLRSEIGP